MNVLKHTLTALAALAATLTFTPLARAANTNSPAPRVAGDRLAALRVRMQETARELNLTPEQKQQLQTIARERAEKLRKLRQDNTLSSVEKRQKLAAARGEIVAEVKKVLTPDQFEKWKARMGLAPTAAADPLARLHQAINDLNLTDDQK